MLVDHEVRPPPHHFTAHPGSTIPDQPTPIFLFCIILSQTSTIHAQYWWAPARPYRVYPCMWNSYLSSTL
jgi:hypothetical protein